MDVYSTVRYLQRLEWAPPVFPIETVGCQSSCAKKNQHKHTLLMATRNPQGRPPRIYMYIYNLVNNGIFTYFHYLSLNWWSPDFWTINSIHKNTDVSTQTCAAVLAAMNTPLWSIAKLGKMTTRKNLNHGDQPAICTETKVIDPFHMCFVSNVSKQLGQRFNIHESRLCNYGLTGWPSHNLILKGILTCTSHGGIQLPFFRGIKHCKCMAILRDFPKKNIVNTLFGLVI